MDIEKRIKKQRKLLEKLGSMIKKAKEKNDIIKQARIKAFLIKFLLDLRQFGIIVEFNKGDGINPITKTKLNKIDIVKLYTNYALDAIEKTELEIERRKKKNEQNKQV